VLVYWSKMLRRRESSPYHLAASNFSNLSVSTSAKRKAEVTPAPRCGGGFRLIKSGFKSNPSVDSIKSIRASLVIAGLVRVEGEVRVVVRVNGTTCLPCRRQAWCELATACRHVT
jgi:hypothetical protein